MDIYNYDAETGIFVGRGTADPDPLQPGSWLIPAFATDVAPPEPNPNNYLVFANGSWGYVLITAPEGPSTPEPQEPAPHEPPPPPTIDDVAAERARRIAVGFTYVFDDERGAHFFATTPDDMVGWGRVTTIKDALFQAGDDTTLIHIRSASGPLSVTGPEWNAILLYEAASFEQPLWQASFVIEDMDPIPDDYTDGKYWPVPGQAPPPPNDDPAGED